MKDKCPKCGAGDVGIGENIFECDSWIMDSYPETTFVRSKQCYDRQIANLQASLDETNRLLRYQEERNHSLNERLNEAEDRLERLLGEL